MSRSRTTLTTGLPDDANHHPTVFDVARVAGCSISTVSRALNNPTRVSPEARQRVISVAAQLGYVPNASARTLRSSKSSLIGAIIPTLNHAIYARMIESMRNRLAQSSVSLLQDTIGYDLDLELQQTRLLIEKGIEGILLVGAQHRPETLQLLRDRSIPFVITYAVSDSPDIPFVGFDNSKAGALAARHLIDLGHRNLAMIAGITRDNDRAAQRVEAFLKTAKAAGISRENVPIVEAPYRMDSGQSALHFILDTRPQTTAVFCASDILAIGAMKECRDRGVLIPQDLSLVGFDNLEIAEYLSPGLTTIEVPAQIMGERAAEYFLAGTDLRRLYARTELETRLILRNTTAPPSSVR
jgi:LacI family transcriptional regulator